MRIIDGVRYRDEDAKELGLTGGREAPEGDRDLDRTAYAPAHVSKAQAKKASTILTTEASDAPKTEDTLKPDEAPVDGDDKGEGDASKTSRRAR